MQEQSESRLRIPLRVWVIGMRCRGGFRSDTDHRMLGLHVGTYTFVVDAPGFFPVRSSALVRTTSSSPLVFTLSREPGLRSEELPSNIQSQIAAANVLRDQGRFDQAITTYQEIRAKHAAEFVGRDKFGEE